MQWPVEDVQYIIPVKVFEGSQMVTCNAFLDPGSNVSFVTVSLAEKLRSQGSKQQSI